MIICPGFGVHSPAAPFGVKQMAVSTNKNPLDLLMIFSDFLQPLAFEKRDASTFCSTSAMAESDTGAKGWSQVVLFGGFMGI